jgi:uncharacterized membrane protein
MRLTAADAIGTLGRASTSAVGAEAAARPGVEETGEAAVAVVVSPEAVAASAAVERAEAGEKSMKIRHFLSKIDEKAVVNALREAEPKSSGHIRVFVSHHKIEDPVAAATKRFSHLNLDRTRHRNAVLIFVAPKTHKFAIIGDTAVHEKCGEEFWTKVAGEMSEYFKQDKLTEAITHGTAKAGELLGEHFPKEQMKAKHGD